jgi:hypothetical protein
VPTRLAYELSHVVDGHSARHAGAGVSLPDSARTPAGGAGGVPAALQMTPPGDWTEAQARRFASTGGWGPQVRPGGAVPVSGSSLRAVQAAIAGPGTPLDGPARRELEPALGSDLGAVRVHTDPAAAASARVLGANAYTVGPDIVFAPGRYQPTTGAGRRLLAHEIAHVTQQAASGTPVIAADFDVSDVLGVFAGPGAAQIGKALDLSGIDLLEAVARGVLGETMTAILREFLIGFQEGIEDADPKQMQRLSDKFGNFGIEGFYSLMDGYAVGVLEGLWDSVKGLVQAVISLAQLPVMLGKILNTPLPELAARIAPRLAQFTATIGELQDELGKMAGALLTDPQVLEEFIDAARTAVLTQVRAGGKDAAAQFLGFLDQSWSEIGKKFGHIVGRIVFEVLLAVLTDLIGNLVKKLGQLVSEFTVWVVENVAEVLRALGRLIGQALEWVQATLGRLAGKARQLFERLKVLLTRLKSGVTDFLDVTQAKTTAGGMTMRIPKTEAATTLKPPPGTSPATVKPTTGVRIPETPTPKSSFPSSSRGGVRAPRPPAGTTTAGVTGDTIELFKRRPELKRALERGGRAAEALRKCASFCYPEFASPSQIDRLDRMLKSAEDAGLQYDSKGLTNYLRGTKSWTELEEAINTLAKDVERKIGVKGAFTEAAGPYAEAPIPAGRPATTVLRGQPGVVTGGATAPTGGVFPRVGGIVDYRMARIPGRIAARMRGMHFENFDAFRETLWRLVADDPGLRAEFAYYSENSARMRDGLAPWVPSRRVGAARVESVGSGSNAVYQLNHQQALKNAGDVYNLDNLEIVTPKTHGELGD